MIATYQGPVPSQLRFPADDRALSAEAKALRRRTWQQPLESGRSIICEERFKQAIESLNAACREASTADWDRYGARAVDCAALGHALRFLSMLPATARLPDISVDPDGEIAFEWYVAPRHVLTVSVNGTGALSYAGLFGRNKASGVEQVGCALPDVVASSLRRLFAT